MALGHVIFFIDISCCLGFLFFFLCLQKIDGFLAVLNITGGNFSPPCQKLPFAVTSVNGDSCLIYYASIDLAGNLPSSKSKGSKLKRSLSNGDSRAARSRLRIPMKGRIQLVPGFLALNWLVIKLGTVTCGYRCLWNITLNMILGPWLLWSIGFGWLSFVQNVFACN